MATVESKKKQIQKSTKEVFDFLCDFTHFGMLVPDKVTNWTSTTDTCSFDVSGVGHVSLKIADKNPYTSIHISEGEGISLPVKFSFQWLFAPQSENTVSVQAVFNLDINPMMAMMVKKPLQNFVDILVEKLKERMEMA
jgi:hypothetical protein